MIIQKAPNKELYDEVIKDRERLKKEAEDALKANKKNADEIAKYHGKDTKKPIKNKALKSMHLSEGLFENSSAFDIFVDEVSRALFSVCDNYEGVSPDEVERAVDNFISTYDFPTSDDYEIPGFEGTFDELDNLSIFKESWSVYYKGDNPEEGTIFDEEAEARKFCDEMGEDWEVAQLDESAGK